MKIALVGIGKIAKDQHVPAIQNAPDWELAATVSRAGTVDGVEAWTDFAAMLNARPDIPVISLCLPPVPRFDYAEAAIRAGRHVMLEKPPGATLSECRALLELAQSHNVSLFATWHSREAAMVDAARDWLSGQVVQSAHITWAEDVRKWHPGQDWIFEPGGMGVFDPGINALSILTKILPAPVHLQKATLDFPANRQTPIAADLTFSDSVTAHFNWLQTGPQTWDIKVVTARGTLLLSDGGATLSIDGQTQTPQDAKGEYPRLYDRMASLVRTNSNDADLSPLRHVADAFMLGERRVVDAFEF